MTSVLNYGGLNYQVGNPVRAEMQNIRRELTDTRSLVETSVKDSVDVRTDNIVLKRAVGQLQNAVTQLQANMTQLQVSLQNVLATNQALSSNLAAVAQHLNFTLPNTVAQAPAPATPATVPATAQVSAEDEDEEEDAPPPPPKKKGGRPRTVPTGVVIPQEYQLQQTQTQNSGFINVQ
ncbi:hypothetical protein EB118_09560 [bacterium]|nr:hypothetical protein [bacterium]